MHGKFDDELPTDGSNILTVRGPIFWDGEDGTEPAKRIRIEVVTITPGNDDAQPDPDVVVDRIRNSDQPDTWTAKIKRARGAWAPGEVSAHATVKWWPVALALDTEGQGEPWDEEVKLT